MYVAIVRKKTNFLTKAYRDYHRFEDAISSIVFDPLEYVPASESFDFLSQLFEGKPSAFKAEMIKLHFWKKLRKSDSGWVSPENWSLTQQKVALDRHVEPDLIIEYSGERGEKRYYIIEVKWESPESEREMFKQWSILNVNIQRHAMHILLQKNNVKSCSNPGAVICEWRQLVRKLQAWGQQCGPQFNTWRERVTTLLPRLESQLHSFAGFAHIQPPEMGNSWKFRSFDTAAIVKHSTTL